MVPSVYVSQLYVRPLYLAVKCTPQLLVAEYYVLELLDI